MNYCVAKLAKSFGNAGKRKSWRLPLQVDSSVIKSTSQLDPLAVAGDWERELLDLSADLIATSIDPALSFSHHDYLAWLV